MPGLSLGNGGPRSGGRVGRRAARERQVAQLVCARMSSRPACCRVVRIVRGRAFVAAASWRRRGRMVPSLAAETPRRAPLWPVEGCPRRAPKPLPLMNNTVAPSHLLCFLRLQPHSLQHSMIFTVTSRRLPSHPHSGIRGSLGHPRPQDISRDTALRCDQQSCAPARRTIHQTFRAVLLPRWARCARAGARTN